MKKSRLLGFDIFRILQIFPIMHFHCLEAFFYLDKEPSRFFESSLYSTASFYSHSFSTGGLSIIAISFFLLGRSNINLQKRKYLIIICSLGVVSLNLFYAFSQSGDFYFEWDVYHYLLVLIICLYLLEKFQISYQTMPFFFILSLIPFWMIDLNSPLLNQILIGECKTSTLGIWALFPWLFWGLFFWSFGKYIKFHPQTILQAQKYKPYLFIFGILAFGLASFLHFFPTPVGPGFSCYIHRPPFLAYALYYFSVICLFLSFLTQEKKCKLLSWVSKLYWNKKLGVTYLCHIFILSLSLNFFDFTTSSGIVFIAFVAFQFLSAEALSRLLFLGYYKCQKY